MAVSRCQFPLQPLTAGRSLKKTTSQFERNSLYHGTLLTRNAAKRRNKSCGSYSNIYNPAIRSKIFYLKGLKVGIDIQEGI
jgi:hypothetical protein